MKYYVETSLENIEAWSGGRDTLEVLIDKGICDTVENILNDILHTRGHVFLNEVYDALGFPHTPQGAVLGWIDGEGDNCIDFGLYDQNKENVRRFVNGVDNVIMLEFNHDGVIWDRI